MIINYQNVCISQDNNEILKNISFQVEKGDFVFLTGLVGTGKTTFLRSLYAATEIKGDKADVLGIDLLKIKSKATPALRRQLGIVFQDFKLLSDRTVYANLEFVLKATGWKKKTDIANRIQEVLNIVQLSGKEQCYPHELSGGEQQRTAIARAILNRPPLIIADEPTGNLDPDSSVQIVKILEGISDEGTCVIMSTHNPRLIPLVDKAQHYTFQDGHISRSE